VAVGGGMWGIYIAIYVQMYAVMLKEFQSALDLPYNRVRTLVWFYGG
jgi:hypothetical protein